MDKEASEDPSEQGVNKFALIIEDVGGMDKIHECQNNINEEIYMKAFNIIGKYFADEEEAGVDMDAPSQPQGPGGFGFNQQQQQQQPQVQGQQGQQSGFNFANGGDSMDM